MAQYPPPPGPYQQYPQYPQYPPGGRSDQPITRPGKVTAAAVILIVLGSLGCIFGVIAFIGAAAVGGAGLGSLGGVAAGVLVAVGVVSVAFGVLEIVAGAKILSLSHGWRIAGIVLSSIAAVFSLIGAIGSLSARDRIDFETFTVSSGPDFPSLIGSVLVLAAYVIVIVLLVRTGRYFHRPGMPTYGQQPPPPAQGPPEFTA
jgi:hypothetical protein